MSKVFIISDLHLNHKNLAEKRGFGSVEEHDSVIVENWNKVVSKRDLVWILGDVCMESTAPFLLLGKMNGMKKLVMGNHDKGAKSEIKQSRIHDFFGMVRYKGFWLTHAPIHPSELRGKKNIHGHIHTEIIEDENYINVCCENVNYTPVDFDYIKNNHYGKILRNIHS